MPRDSPKTRWCFTWNNYETAEGAFTLFSRSPDVHSFVFQEEVGERGTPHLQGYLRLKKKKRFSWLQNGGLGTPRIHWEPCRDVDASITYCSDPAKRAVGGGVFRWGELSDTGRVQAGDSVLRHYTEDELGLIDESELYVWQQQLLGRLLQPADDRHILWRWESTGNTGKTALAKYLVYHHKALYVSGKFADIAQGFVHFAKANGGEAPKIILIDAPRCNVDYISYQAMEKLKDGMMFTSKYESQMLQFPSPHVVVFANCEPNLEKLSEDRWDVKMIERDSLDVRVLVPNTPELPDWSEVFN